MTLPQFRPVQTSSTSLPCRMSSMRSGRGFLFFGRGVLPGVIPTELCSAARLNTAGMKRPRELGRVTGCRGHEQPSKLPLGTSPSCGANVATNVTACNSAHSY
jgi:hypothetical protein